jgi:hypothetical protein
MLFPSSILLCPCPLMKSAKNDDENQQNANSDDQQQFRTDPFLIDLVRGFQCCFAAIPHAKDEERRQNFIHSVQMAKKMHIVSYFEQF